MIISSALCQLLTRALLKWALWSLLGERGVDSAFMGKLWRWFGLAMLKTNSNLKMFARFTAPYGELPDLGQVDFDRDVVFTWNGTTSGARVPNGDWIDANRKGLTICDATSAAFAQDLDFEKLDVVTYSWQQSFGWGSCPWHVDFVHQELCSV